MDSESNRYLNLTFYVIFNFFFNIKLKNARGTFIGEIYSSDSRTSIGIVFSVQTNETIQIEFNAIVAVPGSIQSKKLVCIHPANNYDAQICNWLNYIAKPLQVVYKLKVKKIYF